MFFAGCTSDNVRIVEADAVSDKVLASCGMDRAELPLIKKGHIQILQAMMIYGADFDVPKEEILRAVSKSTDEIPYHNLTVNPNKVDGADTSLFDLTFEPKIKCPITMISSSLNLDAVSEVNLTELTFQIE